MHWTSHLLAVLALQAVLPGQVGAPDRDQSKYWQLPTSTIIPTRTVVRQETLTLTQAANVFVQSDGTLAPTSWPTRTRAWMQIKINGTPATNTSFMDWSRSVGPRVHSYNAVGAMLLPAGTHTVELEADTQAGTVVLGARSNLCVFVNPAEHVVQTRLNQDTPPIQSTLPIGQGPERCTWFELTYSSVLRLPIPDPEVPIFTFASAHVYDIASAGDMMLGIFPENPAVNTEKQIEFQATFSVQDVWTVAEFRSPIYCQGVWRGTQPSEFDATLTLGATGYPPSTPHGSPLQFAIGAGATMVAIHGGLQVKGWAANTAGAICDPICIGGTAAGCPPMETRVVISSAVITVPPGHDGRILFAGKARNQGQGKDGASHTRLEFTIDGKDVGSVAEQGLAGWLGGWDACKSQRTMATSYLATGANALTPGTHVIRLVATVSPTVNPARTIRVSIWDDDPFIVWFD